MAKWDRKNDSIIYLDREFDENFEIVSTNSFVMHKDYYKYGLSYLKSAYIIYEELWKSDNYEDISECFFPLLQLYRHSLNLFFEAIALKNDNVSFDKLLECSHLEDTFDYSLKLNNYNNRVDNCEWVRSFTRIIDEFFDQIEKYGFPDYFFLIPDIQKSKNEILFTINNNMTIAYKILSDYYENGVFNDINYNKISNDFIPSRFWKYSYTFGKTNNEFSNLKDGYEKCALILNKKCKSTKDKDLFYPMCSLYRSCYESYMKYLIKEYGSLNEKESNSKIRHRFHSVISLWNDLKTCIDDDQLYEYLDESLIEYHYFDSTGVKFKYPCNKKGNYYFKNNKTYNYNGLIKSFEDLLNNFKLLSVYKENEKVFSDFEEEEIDKSFDSITEIANKVASDPGRKL